MLNVDKFFVKSLTQASAVTTIVGTRIFDPARTTSEELEDKIPYIIVTYDGGASSSSDNKDDVYAKIDTATVSVLVCAASRSLLATLADAVEAAVETAFASDDIYTGSSWNFEISDCSGSAGPVNYDQEKPCCFQTLTYNCNLQ